MGTILTVTSIFAVAATALLVLWGLYGSELEELSVVNAHRAFDMVAGKPQPKRFADPEKPTEKTGAQRS